MYDANPKMPGGAYIGEHINSIPQTSFGAASSTMEEARSLAERISMVVDRMCGPTPQEAGIGGRDNNRMPALFTNLRDDAERTSHVIRQAHDQLNRLERELP